MQQGYPNPVQYSRGGYGGYGMGRGGYPPQNPMAYGQYAPGYPQPYSYPQYPGMYGAPQGYIPDPYGMMRGRGGFYAPGGRSGFRGGRGGFRPFHKKRPFVGGSLETQKEWERQTACCFYKQGNCKFGEKCRFLHEENSDRPCQFGDKCRVHSTKADKDSKKSTSSEESTSPTTSPATEAVAKEAPATTEEKAGSEAE